MMEIIEQVPIVTPDASQLHWMGLSRRFPNGKGFGPMSLSLAPGRICTLIGPNGCGKTTFVRVTAGLEGATSGELSVFGHRVIDEHVRGRVLGVVLQGSEPWPHLNVLENVVLALKQTLRLPETESRAKALQAIDDFGLSDRLRSMPDTLSGGLRQRLVLARCFAMGPRAVLLDEVTSALDPDWAERVRLYIQAFADAGGAVLSVTHRVNFAKRSSNWIVFMCEGIAMEQGLPEEVLERPRHPELRRFIENA